MNQAGLFSLNKIGERSLFSVLSLQLYQRSKKLRQFKLQRPPERQVFPFPSRVVEYFLEKLLDPFRTVTWDAKTLDADPVEVGSSAAVAVGLALRRVGDR